MISNQSSVAAFRVPTPTSYRESNAIPSAIIRDFSHTHSRLSFSTLHELYLSSIVKFRLVSTHFDNLCQSLVHW